MNDSSRQPTAYFDRHAPSYRTEAEGITHALHEQCPIAWTETYGGHWVASGHSQVFSLATHPGLLSNRHDLEDPTSPYRGTGIPEHAIKLGFLEMDPPTQRDYRDALNPYLSPAAIRRWKPMAEDLATACLDEVVESGSMDIVDDLANVVPAVLTLGLLGLPLADWEIYCEPTHAALYTPPDSPHFARVIEQQFEVAVKLAAGVAECRKEPRPGLVDALLRTEVDGAPLDDQEVVSALFLLIGGGFDTTTALTAHSLEWLSQNPEARSRLKDAESTKLTDSATEEFLRYFTPAPGDARTIAQDCKVAGVELRRGDRVWLSFAMANRDPAVFPDADILDIERPRNRHSSFGLGVHRCIGSNLARMLFKVMLAQVLDRIPDYVCDEARTVRYETIGMINGMQHLPATFTPGSRLGAGLAETIARWQKVCDSGELMRRPSSGDDRVGSHGDEAR